MSNLLLGFDLSTVESEWLKTRSAAVGSRKRSCAVNWFLRLYLQAAQCSCRLFWAGSILLHGLGRIALCYESGVLKKPDPHVPKCCESFLCVLLDFYRQHYQFFMCWGIYKKLYWQSVRLMCSVTIWQRPRRILSLMSLFYCRLHVLIIFSCALRDAWRAALLGCLCNVLQ